MKKLILSLSVVVMAIAGGVVDAHPLPKTANPKPNALLTSSPTEIRIGYSEGLEIAFTGLELDGPDGKPVATGTPSLDPNDNKLLIVPIKVTLTPGSYTVNWHMVGTDTHHVTGHYSFQVKP